MKETLDSPMRDTLADTVIITVETITTDLSHGEVRADPIIGTKVPEVHPNHVMIIMQVVQV